MTRLRPLALFAAGLLVGLLLASAAPDLLVERQTIIAGQAPAYPDLLQGRLAQQGWQIGRVDGAGQNPHYFYHLERPRLRLP